MTAAPPELLRVELLTEPSGPGWPETLAIRRIVFAGEQRIADVDAPDPEDANSLHAVAWLEPVTGDAHRRAVGIGRITLNHLGRDEALIAWIATLPETRRRGVAAAVLGRLLAEADAAGISQTVLAAQRHAEGFYGRFGFFASGTPYMVGAIPHRWMIRFRPQRPTVDSG
jgi:predicted GNAT family N-acyltransferase